MININNIKSKHKKLLFLSLVAFSLTSSAYAQNDSNSTMDLGIIDVGASIEDLISTAPFQAPSKASLLAKEPASIIDQHYIEHNAAPIANYTDIISISPSVTDIAPNGPGGMESMGTSIRGFQDGQYNVTFDAMPISDSNDFTHHSPDYLMSQDVSKIVVDRGPGNASTIGVATFGGTVAVSSKNPESKSSITPFASLGSYNTQLYGLKYETGKMKELGDTKAYISVKDSSTDGALTYAHQKRYNILVKSETPLGENTVMTLFAMYNNIHQNVPIGATKAQIAKYGSNYGLTNDPTSQSYYKYNYDDIGTDIEYVDLRSYIGDWTLHNKLYSYAYRHNGHYGADVNGETPNGTSFGANDVPGQSMTMNYRSIGDVFRASKPIGDGILRAGIWLDHQNNSRSEYNVDWTLGGAIDTTQGNNGYNRLMDDTLDTVQPYVEYEWKPTQKLSIEPGVKVSSFGRSISATVNQKTLTPLSYSQTWTKALPSLSIHYKLLDNWTTYAQWAKGYLAPNLNTFYVTDPSKNQNTPEETVNYQLGTVYETKALTLSGDVYYIDFSNKVESRNVANEKQFYNAGGAIYQGIEAEATYNLLNGFSLYGNGSLNSAKTKDTKEWLADVADHTYAAGLIYNKYNAYASLIAKNIGTRYGDSGNTQKLSDYTVTNFNASYHFKDLTSYLENTDLGLQINNIFNKTNIMALAGYTGQNGTPLYWSLPGTSFNVSLSMKF